MGNTLSRITIKGFKSIKECDIELGNINVLIGANGAGKSNFISVFELLKNCSNTRLAYYGDLKGTNSLFYNGNKTTEKIELAFDSQSLKYYINIGLSEDNILIANDRMTDFPENSGDNKLFLELKEYLYFVEKNLLSTYHFKDTSTNANIKQKHNVSNNIILHEDARNLAAFLYRLRQHFPSDYTCIVKTIRRVAPYFDDFVLRPEEGNNELIFLRWRQKGWEDVLNPSQLSDGTLRFICLATALLQPSEIQPAIIIIDEPELGLHPYAITLFAELVKKVASKKQIIISTQSVELLDHFEPEDVIVVDRTENGSQFKRLDAERLAAWLEDEYTLGELWNKNILGGRVSR